MAEPSEALSSIRGRFELSVDTGELRQDGVRLKLSSQAIEVLLLLVTRLGKVVAREELQQKLWPGASYGNPEHGLNAAVNRLRETLGDSATEPKYIETVPGRGYRFIARLNHPFVPPGPEPSEPEPTSEPPRPRWWKRKAALAIAACVPAWRLCAQPSNSLLAQTRPRLRPTFETQYAKWLHSGRRFPN
jgi:DNA-binding winged helix-turn-helix (wHTH) protein